MNNSKLSKSPIKTVPRWRIVQTAQPLNIGECMINIKEVPLLPSEFKIKNELRDTHAFQSEERKNQMHIANVNSILKKI